jgi:hypothetical protein
VKANNKDLVESLQSTKLEICENFADSMTDLNQSLQPLDSKKSANYISPKFQEASAAEEEEEEEEEGGDQHSAQEYIACTAEEGAIKQCVLMKGNIASLLDKL